MARIDPPLPVKPNERPTMVPKLMSAKLGLPSYYFSYAIGFIVYGLIYYGQRVKYKKQQLALA